MKSFPNWKWIQQASILGHKNELDHSTHTQTNQSSLRTTLREGMPHVSFPNNSYKMNLQSKKIIQHNWTWLIYEIGRILLTELNYIQEEAHDQIFDGSVFVIYFVQNQAGWFFTRTCQVCWN